MLIVITVCQFILLSLAYTVTSILLDDKLSCSVIFLCVRKKSKSLVYFLREISITDVTLGISLLMRRYVTPVTPNCLLTFTCTVLFNFCGCVG